ncbi:MAG: GNAT family protein [Gudongella sp.]|nr:GNAT family protein [Gudongella sp.]
MGVINTERLRLRRFKLSDLNDFYEYAKNPNVGPNAGWEYHKSKNESILLLNSFIKSKEVWAIELKESSKVIGSVGIHQDKKRENSNARMIGYVLNQDYWGRGYATEAVKKFIEYSFDSLKLDILSVYHYSFNEKSKRVIEKCGFQFEGMLRESSVILNGEVYDDMCYSILEREYRESLSKKDTRLIAK